MVASQICGYRPDAANKEDLVARIESRTVAVALGMRNYQKANHDEGLQNLMAFAGEDAYTASRHRPHRLSFDLHEDFTIKDVKELLCFSMVMANLGRARRHDFFEVAHCSCS